MEDDGGGAEDSKECARSSSTSAHRRPEAGRRQGAAAGADRRRALAREEPRVADDFVVRRVGVDAARIRVASRGQANPEASNETAEGRAANRRVEFYFFYPDGEPLRSLR
ncbi:MAG: hypothetical protein R3A79_10050 [Nannocystaceae bacterium]